MKKSDGKGSVKKSDLPKKDCVVCKRPFIWRKKWEKIWDEVKFCSERCRGQRSTLSDTPKTINQENLDQVVQMAWEHRTPFDAITTQFGLSKAQTIEVMQRNLNPASFKAWRQRVNS